jgi:hypothetical protein
MTDREALIARKQMVRRQIEETRRKLTQARQPASGKPNTRRIRQLEDKLDRLMAEEYTLRLAIDRSR